MRKLIIAGAVALVLFIVGAFAASFAVDSEDVASGADPVEACADSVDVDFTTAYSDDAGAYVINEVVLTFDSTGCDGRTATLALDQETLATEEIADIDVVGTTATVDLSDSPLLAEEVSNAAVLVDGRTITAS
jgi:hypothetical protein